MEADNVNPSEDIYGELNALLNDLTSGEPDASKTSPVKEQMKKSESENAHDKDSEEEEEEKSSIVDFVKDPVSDKIAESIDKDLLDLDESVEKEESSEKQPNDSAEVDEKVLDSESEAEIEQLKDNLECPLTSDDIFDNLLKEDEKPATDNEIAIPSLECNETLEELIPEFQPDEENSEIVSKENLIDASIATVPATEDSSDLPDGTKEPGQEPSPSTNSANGKNEATSSPQDKESSENLIDLLKKLSPEKLKEIQTKVFTDTKEQAQEDEQMEVDSSTSPGPVENDKKIEKEDDDDDEDDDVILIDSDDDDPPPVIPKKVEPAPKRESLSKEVVSTKRRSKENSGGETKKFPKRSKECINPDCPRDSEEFTECTKLILNFYYADKKMDRAQYVCLSCSDKAILKYEVSSMSLYY